MVDMAVMHGYNQILDVRMPTRWQGKYLGYNAYEYTLGPGGNSYIAMTGADVDSYFTVPHDYCLVVVKLKQNTAAGADSNAPISYDLQEQNAMTKEFGSILADAGNFMYWTSREGRTWEASSGSMMLRMNGVDGHLVYPVLTLQYLKAQNVRNR